MCCICQALSVISQKIFEEKAKPSDNDLRMKAAIYARVSKERCTACGHLHDEHGGKRKRCTHTKCKCQAYVGQDPENQLVELRRYATAQSWEIVEYIDRATGKDAERDALQDMFRDASRAKFNVVLVWALDRLTREGTLKTLLHIDRLAGYGVKFESYTEPFFRTMGPAGELVLSILAWVAKQERLRISERTKAGLAMARHKGVRLGRPFKVFDRARAAALRSKGYSWRAISAKMNVGQSTLRMALKHPPGGVQQTPSRPRSQVKQTKHGK
jgi:DNA invertase Pin-like site-specific DNA recombinase